MNRHEPSHHKRPGRLTASPSHRLIVSSARGFTLLELLIAVAVLAIVAALVTPSFSRDERVRVSAAAMILASDIEYAQVMSIAYPRDPVVVRFGSDNVSYWLAPAASPDDPILRPDTEEPYFVRFGEGRAAAGAGVRFSLRDMPGRTLQFEPHGGLADFVSRPNIAVHAPAVPDEPAVNLAISPTTGSITESMIAPGSGGGRR